MGRLSTVKLLIKMKKLLITEEPDFNGERKERYLTE
jgi:hypothetical protein